MENRIITCPASAPRQQLVTRFRSRDPIASSSVFSLWSLASTALLLLLATFIVGCSAEAKRDRYMKRADAFFDKGEYIKAELEYRNAARLSKNVDPHLVTRLATIFFEEGRITEAYPLLTNAISLRPNDMKLRCTLGIVHTTFRQFKEARDIGLFVLSKQPTNEDAILLFADASIKPDEVQFATQAIGGWLRTNRETWAAHIALAQLAFRDKQTNLAANELGLASKLAPNVARVNVALAQWSSLAGRSLEAEKFLRLAADESPKRSQNRILLAQFLLQGTNASEGKAITDKLIKEVPDYIPASALRAQIALSEREYETCSSICRSILSWSPLSYEIRLLSARSLILQKRSTDALEELDRIVSINSQLPEVHYEAAVAYVQNGASADAVRKLDEAIRLNPDYLEAVILRAEIKLRTGATDDAVASLLAFTRTHPNFTRPYFVLANAYRLQGRLDEALGIYNRFSRNAPSAPEFPYLSGVVLLQQNKVNEARLAFEQSLKLNPGYLPAAEQLVNLDIRNSDFAAAQRRVADQLSRTTNSVGSLLLQASVQVAMTNFPAAEATLLRVIQADPNVIAPYSMLAGIYLQKGDPKKSVAELEDGAKRNPGDVTSRMLIGSICRDRLQEYDRAKAAYESVLKISPRMPAALNDMAYLLSEKLDRVEDALPYATRAHDLAPNDPGIADTLGWILYRRGDISRALPLLNESAEKLPEHSPANAKAEVRYHLGMACYAMGDLVLAKSVFESVNKLDPKFAQERGVPSLVAVLDLDPAQPKSIETFESVLKQRPNDYLATLKLGQAQEYAGASEKARSAFERASKLNPASFQPHLSLATLYFGQLKDFPKALEAARTAKKLAPNNPEVSGALGRAAFRMSDYATSLGELQTYAKSDRADMNARFDLALAYYSVGQFDQCRSALTEYVAIPRASHLDSARGLLTLLDFTAGKVDARQAQPIAAARLKIDESDLPALMTLGLVDQQQQKFSDAAQKFEKITTMDKLLPQAQRQLAVLYAEHLQNDKKACELGAKVRQFFPNDVDLAFALGKANYREGDFKDAIRYLNEGLAGRPDNATARFFLGMAYYNAKRMPEAKVALNQAVANKLDSKLLAEASTILKQLK